MNSEPLFPGFNTPPVDPARDLTPRPAINQAPHPDDDDEPFSFDDDEEPCRWCEGYGYKNCFCGGDLCVCSHSGEIPCPYCS